MRTIDYLAKNGTSAPSGLSIARPPGRRRLALPALPLTRRSLARVAALFAVDIIDKPSFRERITAIDRACKAGFVDVLDRLVEHGAILTPMRLNRQVRSFHALLRPSTPFSALPCHPHADASQPAGACPRGGAHGPRAGA